MEATVSNLTSAIHSLKSERAEFESALKVKTAMIDDNTDSIRTLKQQLASKEAEIKNVREEHQRNFTALTGLLL